MLVGCALGGDLVQDLFKNPSSFSSRLRVVADTAAAGVPAGHRRFWQQRCVPEQRHPVKVCSGVLEDFCVGCRSDGEA